MAKTNSKRDSANTKTDTSRKPAEGKTNVREKPPMTEMTLYDVAGPRCMDCAFCGMRDYAREVFECRYNPPGPHGWPKISGNIIDRAFCAFFTTVTAHQPLQGDGDLPRIRRLEQFNARRGGRIPLRHEA